MLTQKNVKGLYEAIAGSPVYSIGLVMSAVATFSIKAAVATPRSLLSMMARRVNADQRQAPADSPTAARWPGLLSELSIFYRRTWAPGLAYRRSSSTEGGINRARDDVFRS